MRALTGYIAKGNIVGVKLEAKAEAVAIEFWWKQVRRYHRLFFRLVDEQAENLHYIPNIELCINILEHSYMQLIRMAYPHEADTIRAHLLSATRHLIDSLRRLRKAQKHESAIMLNLASGDMALLRYELMGLGIS
jgi:hypothetical protein